MEASISLKKVGKLVKGKTILASLTFGVERGSIVAIIGDNEAGKSMLLKVISGIEHQEYGQVFINGLDSQKRRIEVMSSIGFVPHEVDLDPWLTVEQNIQFIGLLYGIDTETLNTRMVQLARELHIIPFLKSMVSDIRVIESAREDSPRLVLEPEEQSFKDAIRYRLVLRNKKNQGDKFNEKDFDFLRSECGIDVSHMGLVIENMEAASSLNNGQIIDWQCLRGTG